VSPMSFSPSESLGFVLASIDPWSSALGGGFALRCGLIGGVSLVVGLLAARVLWYQRPRPRKWASDRGEVGWRTRVAAWPGWSRLRSESGTATVEFTLAFVPALFVCLILLQTVLAFSGNFFVHYAAYAATRSAVVQAPDGRVGGGGQIFDDIDHPAYRAATRAAAFALAPVSGKLGDTAGTPDAFADGLAEYFDAYGRSPPRWVGTLSAQRFAYALEHTGIRLVETTVTEGEGVRLRALSDDRLTTIVYGPKDPVTLQVDHKLHLSIPYASVFFADGTHATSGGRTAYADISAIATLPLEGVDRNLPPQPTLPGGEILERSP
ncbi:MAG: hypothetical protein AAFX76_10340, partial [Planctomycetota bacterium]